MTRHSIARFVALRALRVKLHAQRIGPLQCRFEALLGEPSTAARALAIDWFFYKQLEREAWAHDSAGGVLRDAARVGAYLNDCPRGVVIATIHMGDYLDGLRRLRLATAARRPIYVLRRRDDSTEEQRAFQRVVGADRAVTVLRTGTGPGVLAHAVRALRRGAIVVALYDLPARFGRTVPVRFFGRAAHFVRGPAELAVVGQADVLPLLCHYDAAGVAVAQAMPVIAARTMAAASRPDAVAAVTQQLCAHAEAHIRRRPGQWAHWNFIDELLMSP
jgi:lauroyl/myristoyl acyltransferase